MRVLYVAAGIRVPGSHGGSVHALGKCRGLVLQGHEVHLAALPGEQGSAPRDLGGVVLHPVRPAPLEQLQFTRYRQVRRIARQVRPDVIVERFYTFGGSGVLAGRKLGVPVVLEHNTPARPVPGLLRDRLDALTLLRPIDRWRQWQLRSAVAHTVNVAVLITPAMEPEVRVIGCGVDCNAFRPGTPVPDGGPLRLVFVSSFRAWHGAVDLVRAVAICVERGVELRLCCLGQGPTLAEAKRIARETGAESSVEFLGSVPHTEVPGFLSRAHVGMAPFNPAAHRALEIGFFWSPVKIFEYLASGLPVITAEIESLRELLPAPVGRFYQAGEVLALADRLAELANNRAALRAAGKAARELAVSSHTWDHRAAELGELLQWAVSRECH